MNVHKYVMDSIPIIINLDVKKNKGPTTFSKSQYNYVILLHNI